MNSEHLRAIGDHLWQSTLFAIVVGLLTWTLRKNRARVRHRVWLAASLKFLVPVSVFIAAGNHIAWRTAPAGAQSGFAVVIDEVSQPFTIPARSAPLPPAAQPAANTIAIVSLGIWACGFMGITWSWLIRWRRIRAAVHAGSPVELEASIKAISSPSLLEPGVFGIFRPVLLLPGGIFDCLPPVQLKAVIAHELCHVRHRDNLIAAIHMFVETAFWFHPLVWWIGKRMIAERERACDEEVLRLGNEPRVYAEGILKVCALYMESPIECASGVTGSDLKKRIQAIVARREVAELSFARKAGLAAIGMACLALPILIGVLNAPALRGEAQSSPRAKVKFRGVSIKPCMTYTEPSGVTSPSPGRLVLNCQTVMGLIDLAYVKSTTGHPRSISGGPGWIGSASYRYQIDGRADDRATLESMEGPMLQALLEDRFQLKIHPVTREAPMYSLAAATNGARLKPSKEGSCTGAWPRSAPVPPANRGNCVAFVGRGQGVTGESQYTTLEGQAVSLEDFCRLIAAPLGLPVIDKTGISGRFDFHLKFANDETPGMLRQLYPSLFSVMEEQLGLKLEPFTGRREFLVIDQVAKPLPGQQN